jgi:hypothetical protein
MLFMRLKIEVSMKALFCQQQRSYKIEIISGLVVLKGLLFNSLLLLRIALSITFGLICYSTHHVPPSPSILSLASQIQTATKLIQEHLKSNSLPALSFAADAFPFFPGTGPSAIDPTPPPPPRGRHLRHFSVPSIDVPSIRARDIQIPKCAFPAEAVGHISSPSSGVA